MTIRMPTHWSRSDFLKLAGAGLLSVMFPLDPNSLRRFESRMAKAIQESAVTTPAALVEANPCKQGGWGLETYLPPAERQMGNNIRIFQAHVEMTGGVETQNVGRDVTSATTTTPQGDILERKTASTDRTEVVQRMRIVDRPTLRSKGTGETILEDLPLGETYLIAVGPSDEFNQQTDRFAVFSTNCGPDVRFPTSIIVT